MVALNMARTATERTLVAIWTDLLGVGGIAIDDDVFGLGAHSLLAIRAVMRIRDAFEVDLPLRNLFEHPTIAGQAAAIDSLLWLAPVNDGCRNGAAREEIAL